MMKLDKPLALLFALLQAPTSSAQSQELELWPDGVPNAPKGKYAPESTQDRPEGGDRHVRIVHDPTITVYRPEAQSAEPLTAVVICPGGGYGMFALDKEGHDIARWFAKSGVVGVMLKYRLPRPAGHIYGHEGCKALQEHKGLELHVSRAVTARATEFHQWRLLGQQ